MIKWEYHDYRPEGFESWSANWKTDYELSVYRIGENRYSIGWYHKGTRVIKDYISAKDWDEAKECAIARVKNYFYQMTSYWQAMRTGFAKWISEE